MHTPANLPTTSRKEEPMKPYEPGDVVVVETGDTYSRTWRNGDITQHPVRINAVISFHYLNDPDPELEGRFGVFEVGDHSDHDELIVTHKQILCYVQDFGPQEQEIRRTLEYLINFQLSEASPTLGTLQSTYQHLLDKIAFDNEPGDL